MLQKLFISNKCWSLDLSIHENTEKQITQLLNTDNNTNQNTKIMSEGSEDWSYNAENSALITGKRIILKYIQIKFILNSTNIFTTKDYCFWCIFGVHGIKLFVFVHSVKKIIYIYIY